MLETIERLRRGEKSLIVCIGDSITEQNYHIHGYLNYVGLFSEKLINTFGRKQFVFNTGMSGGTTTSVLARLEQDALRFKPDLITVMLGINDAKGGEENVPQFNRQMLAIIEAIRNNRSEMLLLTQNYVDFESESAADVRRSYPHYVKAIRAIAASHQVPLCDIHRKWKDSIENNYSLHLKLMNDGLHPNEHGHQFIADTLFEYLGI